MSTVLIIEDEAIAAITLSWIVEEMGHTVVGIAASGDHAESAAFANSPDLILSDIRILGDRDGVEVVRDILKRASPRVVFVTASTDPDTRKRAQNVGASRIVQKPYSQPEIEQAVTEALA